MPAAGVGKYLNLAAARPTAGADKAAVPAPADAPPVAKKPKLAAKPASALTNFDAW
jgi:hypothetical protein